MFQAREHISMTVFDIQLCFYTIDTCSPKVRAKEIRVKMCIVYMGKWKIGL